jgi:hypothetical protein
MSRHGKIASGAEIPTGKPQSWFQARFYRGDISTSSRLSHDGLRARLANGIAAARLVIKALNFL